MFQKLLIANRGEIACRVIKTARAMGIETVAVCSEADRNSLHVEMADEAVLIGSPPSAESYLVADRIVQACKDTGADAVHPGYGFLSENAGFATALGKTGITFVGPPVGAIRSMGDKIESKKIALEAGVNTVPGHLEAIADPEEAVKIARGIGYPVMLKASAGGGGKGMRLAWNDDEVRDGLVSAMNEARASFGDDRVFIEKYIEEPRHIEIQILADSHGNCLYLGERECSIQRRHQKVLEEAPSPFLDEAMRKAMGEQAVALARKVDYVSAGTVEFIVDKDRNFHFLEMNTRLQVEHPVTELVTGLDLVEQMLRIAAGEKLSFTQKDVKLEGWALEARLYAEDPERDFLPSTGRLVSYRPPREEAGRIRVDTGVVEGSEISMFYDPMIAKLITWGETRDEAVSRIQDALDGFHLRGVGNNLTFLSHLVAHPRFREGRLTTNFIVEEYPAGLTADLLFPNDPNLLAAVAAIVDHRTDPRECALAVFLGEQDPVEIAVTIAPGDGGVDRVTLPDGSVCEFASAWRPGDPLFEAVVDGRNITVQVDIMPEGYLLAHAGTRAFVKVVETRLADLQRLMPYKAPPDLSKFLLSPMPGLLVRLSVEEGQEVKPGQELATVEAMKMENVLRAEQAGVVRATHAAPGDTLAVDQIIVEFG